MSTLWLVLRRDCNLACSYCYQTDANPSAHLKIVSGLERAMKRDVWEAGARWAAGWPHDKAPLRVNLYGGEPLMAFQEIKELVPWWNVYFARERGRTINWAVTTNGTLLFPPVQEFMDRFGIGMLLSLDGPKHLHDRTRIRHDGRGSWDQIDPVSLLKWRPKLEIAWQLDPGTEVKPADLDELIDLGFRNINFNVNWLAEWDLEARSWLTYFFRHVGRRAFRKEFSTNWASRFTRAMTIDQKMEQPCGTGSGMLALTPEGWLYPSQEMAFSVFDPSRDPATADWYRVGDVRKDPVIDREAQQRVGGIKVKDMRVTAVGYSCDNCIAKSDCIGGCHCRYVGQKLGDPSYRYDIAPGNCQSMVACHTGLLQAAAIERKVRPVDWKPPAPVPEKKPTPERALAGWGR
jgi:uncharacterized protein